MIVWEPIQEYPETYSRPVLLHGKNLPSISARTVKGIWRMYPSNVRDPMLHTITHYAMFYQPGEPEFVAYEIAPHIVQEGLRKSIEVWEGRLTMYSQATFNKIQHKLCQYVDNSCAKCPVAHVTGKNNCEGSPVWKAGAAWFKVLDERRSAESLRDWGKACTEEIEFLQRLLANSIAIHGNLSKHL